MKLNNKGEMTVGKIIAVLIFVIIALALLPTIMSSINAGHNATNASADKGKQPFVAIIGVFYVIGVLIGAIAWVLKETGGIGKV